MNLSTVAVRNITRNPLRTLLTIFGVAIAILTFVLLRTLTWSWTVATEQSATDRIGVRHKVTFVMPLPKKYVDEVRQVPGVTVASYATWFGGKYPKSENDFFASLAVDADYVLRVYDEIELDPAQVEAWKQNPRGALVGDNLAKRFGWKIGDRVTLRGTFYPGDWEFEISGIYTVKHGSADRSTFFFHWNYLNESLPPRSQDQIGWVSARITDPAQTAQICRAIDQKFDEQIVRTLCMSEQALQASLFGMLSAVLNTVDIVSLAILLVVGLILGNTIAMGVRDRTNEYAMLRAIGFVPRHIISLVVGEAVLIGALGGVVGLLLAYPFVNNVVGRFLEENMGAMFAQFRVQAVDAGLAIGIALVLSMLAAILPAHASVRLKPVDALRRPA